MPGEKSAGESVSTLLGRLLRDGRSWIDAEAEFAKAEVTADGKRVAMILALVALVFGSLFAGLIFLAVFLAVVLAPHIGGIGNAAGVLSLGLLVVAAVSCGVILRMVSKPLGVVAVLKRWAEFIIPRRQP